jgi:hypothetical protein
LRYGVSPSGQRYISFRIPGTGWYWIKYFPNKPEAALPEAASTATPRTSTDRKDAPPSTAVSSDEDPWWQQRKS